MNLAPEFEFCAIIKDLLISFEKNIPSLISNHSDRLKKFWKEHQLALQSKPNENLFLEVASLLSLMESENRESSPHISTRSLFTKLLKDMFGESLILSDFFIALAVSDENENLIDSAIENAGKALVLRIERNGAVNGKTAEGHFILGSLYFKKELYEDARREIFSSRVIYSKLFGERSLPASNCDFILGQLELKLFNAEKAYLGFYKSYYSRFFLFGKDHELTKAAEQMMILVRASSGIRFTCGLELKNKVVELKWNELNQTSCKYIMALFISRLNDDTVLTNDQLCGLISTSMKFYLINFSSHSTSFNPSVEEVLMLLTVPAAPNTSSPHSKNIVILQSHEVVQKDMEISINARQAVSESKQSTMDIDHVKTSPKEQDKPMVSSEELVSKAKVTFSDVPPLQRNLKEDVSTINSHALSPKPVIPKTWRPIPPDSPLRQGKVADFQSQKYNNLINSASSGPRFIRNGNGELLVLTKCPQDILRTFIRPKMILFGLFAWYVKGSAKNILKSPATPAAGATEISKSDPKNALNALFAKRQAPAPEATQKISSEPSASGKFAAHPPRPPPLPSSWPPIPFVISTESTGANDQSFPGSSNSKSKYKLLHLSGLPSIEGTFWCEPQEALFLAEELFDDLEDEFNLTSKKNKKPANSAVVKSPLPAKSPKGKGNADSVLDPQRSQNISIMLAKFGKRSIESIAQSILNFEPTALGTGAISSLLQFIPSPDESAKIDQFYQKKVKEFKENASKEKSQESKLLEQKESDSVSSKPNEFKLGKAENFIWLVSKIPKLEKRLSVMSLLLYSKETSDGIVRNSELLASAVQETKGSGRLKFILRSFLDLNNCVLKCSNSSSPNLVQGFNISSWKKLGQVKLNSGETAQNYVFMKLFGRVPESMEISNDMPSIEEAKSVNLPRMNADLKKLEECVSILQELIDDEKNSPSKSPIQKPSEEPADLPPPPDSPKSVDQASKALTNLTKFITEVGKYLDEAKAKLTSAVKEYSDMCQYYGETYPPMEPEIFFGEVITLIKTIQTFVTNAQGKHRRKAVMG